jgi:sulfoxide reductase catalytic subunit YedY
VFRDRRRLIQGIAAGPILAAGFGSLPAIAAEADPSAGLYPAKRNERYVLDRPVTDEKHSTTYRRSRSTAWSKSR